MDLSWCIICDNRIPGDEADSTLYCSDMCKTKDQSSPSANPSVIQIKPLRSKLSLRSKQQRSTAPSTSYPWIPLYRRRHGTPMSRRCQPIVTSTTATTRCQSNCEPIPIAKAF